MIHGIGVDICDSMRIKNLLDKYQDKFLNRIFIDTEVEYCLTKSNPAPYLAARFAFKEAFFKALNPPMEISFQDIGLTGKEGKKNVYTSQSLIKILDKMEVKNIQFSISHEKHYSIAMVLLEKS
ncbi:MAG: holo-ACP synthase [Spirochaetia bacterium]|nr:holo-ACP synthase [Spirochaetia bacterium]